MKKQQYLLTDKNNNGLVSVEVIGGMKVTINYPTDKIVDLEKMDEKTFEEVKTDAGKFKHDKGQIVKNNKPPLAK